MANAAGKPRSISRRGFLATAAAGTLAGTLAARGADAQAPKTTKDTLRPVVEGSGLAITDAQLDKLAPAVEWSRGEMRKLRDVDAGLGGPAPVFLPAASAPRGSSSRE
jgi:hypothetical protein